MSECSHDCKNCAQDCAERESLLVAANEGSAIGKVIAIISGKGGVGKSTVTSLLAVALSRAGKKVAVLDADLTGPSIPQAFGVHQRAAGSELGIAPARTESGLKIISVNMFLEHEDDPVVWRGPLIAGTVKQFWSQVDWGEIDYLLVDMPPGTGDVALTVFQSLPVEGAVVVATPQHLVSMIVGKAVKMGRMMNVPILALVENMCGFRCPDCGHVHDVFGPSRAGEVAAEYDIPLYASLPLDPQLASLCDAGRLEDVDDQRLAELGRVIASL